MATLIQHRHCPSCGKAIKLSQETCGGECEERQARIQRTRKWFWRGWFVATALILMLVLLYGPR